MAKESLNTRHKIRLKGQKAERKDDGKRKEEGEIERKRENIGFALH